MDGTGLQTGPWTIKQGRDHNHKGGNVNERRCSGEDDQGRPRCYGAECDSARALAETLEKE